MPTSKVALITHPMRSRILAALMQRQLTTQQLAQLLPDIPLPSLYRHVRLLAEAGVLEVVGEVRVGGAPSKVYAVQPAGASLGPTDTAELTGAEHLQNLTGFFDVISQAYRVYLEKHPLRPDDPIHCLMGPLHLSQDEYRTFMGELNELLQRWAANKAGGDRRRLIFAHLALPDLEDPPVADE